MRNFIFALSVFFMPLFSSSSWGVSPFELPWMNTSSPNTVSYKSTDYQGAVWVVEAFFLGCSYCNENAPRVNELQSYFGNDERVQILDVGIDKDDTSYREWIRRHQPNHPVLKDASRMLVRQLGVTSYPSTYVIDHNLNVVFKSSGTWSSTTQQQIKDAVEKALLKIKD